MSSFDGSAQADVTDATLQLAPVGEDGPDFATLKEAFNNCVNDLQPFVDQSRENYYTRYALWPGQSSDGLKHKREGSKIDPTPWDGASDLRVLTTDEAVNAKVALQCTALRKANIVAVPIEGNDIKRAKLVSSLMRWIVNTQIPEMDRETELLSQYLNEKGIAATGQFWEEKQEKTLTPLSLQDLQAQFPDRNVLEMMSDPEIADQLAGLFEEVYGCTGRKAKKMLSELAATGKTTVATIGRRRSRPVVRAFNLDEDLFIPIYATDLETAPAVYRVQYFTPEQLRGFANTDGWDRDWVEAAISTCKGKFISVNQTEFGQPRARSFIYQQVSSFNDLIGVVYAYQRLSDEDGVPGIYLTIFNPMLPPEPRVHEGYAKYGLLGYAHGEYPFVIHRREFLSRRMHDTRGIPEVGKPIQDQIKAHKDGRIDAASIAVNPPLGYPMGRPPGKWGAGARVPERRPGEYHFMDRPAPDMNTDSSEAQLRADFNQYMGFVSRETDPTFASLKNQHEVDKFMGGWAKALNQIYSLFGQFGPEQVYFRVIGTRQQDPILFEKGDAGENFDWYLSWDTQSLDAEHQEKKLEAVAKIAATFDKYGQLDYSELLQLAVEIIDPNWAERIIQPKEVGSQKVVGETHTMLAQVFAGVDRDIDLAAPPDLVMQTIQNYAQAPDVMQRYQQDQAFKARLDKIVKQTDMQRKQNENKRIGKYGA